jgi:hypothetical protein
MSCYYIGSLDFRREGGGSRAWAKSRVEKLSGMFAWDVVLLGRRGGRDGRWKSERKWKNGNGRTVEANRYIDGNESNATNTVKEEKIKKTTPSPSM